MTEMSALDTPSKAGFAIVLAFGRVFPYMRRNIAQRRNVHWPLLDDIPAVGVPFPPT
jgi:hypothetical protein